MISIAIPCYEMGGIGDKILDFSLSIISIQSYKDCEVVITDHSIDNKIEEVCLRWKDKLNIKYFRIKEGRGSPTVNTNCSIKYSSGDIIKLLCQDDYLFSDTSIEKIVRCFDNPEVNWIASSYVHTQDRTNLFNRHIPRYNPRIYLENTIGTPSCIAIRNLKDLPLFDERLIYQYDCDWYKRICDKIGEPYILEDVTMINFLWHGSVTNTLATSDIREKEYDYVKTKHESK